MNNTELLDESEAENKLADQDTPRSFWGGNVRLEFLTRLFVLLNIADLVMTTFLLKFGGFRESNQLADFVLSNWGIAGMVYYKFAFVLGIVLIAQFVAYKKIQAGRFLLVLGCMIVGGVFLYSIFLFLFHAPPPAAT